MYIRFQFHKGTIKTQLPEYAENTRFYFNSIKVRIKPYAGKGIGFGETFQFHKGTIKTPLPA